MTVRKSIVGVLVAVVSLWGTPVTSLRAQTSRPAAARVGPGSASAGASTDRDATAAATTTAVDAAGNPATSFKPEQLEQIVAPVALYPDSLLAQIFMASTYPLEIVQADRWVKDN